MTHGTPSGVTSGTSSRCCRTQDHAVVNVMARLQRSPPPPSVSGSRNSRRFVQPLSIRKVANWIRSSTPTRASAMGFEEAVEATEILQRQDRKTGEDRNRRQGQETGTGTTDGETGTGQALQSANALFHGRRSGTVVKQGKVDGVRESECVKTALGVCSFEKEWLWRA